MPRTKQIHSPARDKLLEQGQALMLAKGFVATTVDEICKAAGVTKGSFFHYFKSKEDLAQAALDRFFYSQLEQVGRSVTVCADDPLVRVYGLIDAAITMAKGPAGRKGCLLGQFAQELSDTHPELREQCAQRFAEWTALLRAELDAVKAKHRPRAHIDTASLAEHLIAVIQGSLILAKAKQDFNLVEIHLNHFKAYLESIFKD